MRDQIKTLAAVVLVALLAYVGWARLSGASLLPGAPALSAGSLTPPPEPETKPLNDLNAVVTVKAAGILGGAAAYDMGGRNLFQYGVIKPPPPSPAELERMRKAEEARLKAMEEEARKRAEEQALRAKAEQEARDKEAAEAAARLAQQPPPPPGPPPPPPPPQAPPIGLKLVGYLGPPNRRIAVFLSGNDIVLGRQGEVVDGKFRVLAIGPDSVEMGYSDPLFKGQKKRLDLGS